MASLSSSGGSAQRTATPIREANDNTIREDAEEPGKATKAANDSNISQETRSPRGNRKRIIRKPLATLPTRPSLNEASKAEDDVGLPRQQSGLKRPRQRTPLRGVEADVNDLLAGGLASLAISSPSPAPCKRRRLGIEKETADEEEEQDRIRHKLTYSFYHTRTSKRPRPGVGKPKLLQSYINAHVREENYLQEATSREVEGSSSTKARLPTTFPSSDSFPRIRLQTLVELLDGKYADLYDEVVVVDARFPYEYNGGHVRGAVNIYTPKMLEERFCAAPSARNERLCIVFHCEFSSKRGPGLCQHLRTWDRRTNRLSYPKLLYPELYVLALGYKGFWESEEGKAYCEPQGYVPMLDQTFKMQMKEGFQAGKEEEGKKQESLSRERDAGESRRRLF